MSPHYRYLPKIFAALVAALALNGRALAQHYTTYDLIVPTSPVSGAATIVDGTGRIMPSDRSYIIGVEGGERSTLVFTNWTAANPNYPVIIVNQHGTGRVVVKDDGVTFRDGIRLDTCAFVKLLGNNDPAIRYGFEVARAGRLPSPGVSRVSRLGVSVGKTSTNVEVAFVEVHHTGFAGIMAKTDPDQSKPETWAANYTMYDLSIHDCYIHDTGGEGMYIGYTGWATDHWADVPGFESHEIIGLKIYNNLIERTMWDGFQYASAPDTASTDVFNNVVIHSGTAQESGQSNGVQIGAGASGRFHDNIIIDSVGNNLALFGIGNNAIYNNLMIEGDNGVFADNRPNPVPSDPSARQTIPGSYYSFYHNTFVNPALHAYWTMCEVTVNNFKNNLSIVPNLAGTDVFADGGASVNQAGNVLLRSDSAANFADASKFDYRILAGSAAIDAGVSLAGTDVPVTTDFQGNSRSSGTAPDAGFSEAGPLSVFLLAQPPASVGGTGSITASTVGGVPPYAYTWSTGAMSPSISGVAQGEYQVTVSDAAGATMTRACYLIAGAELAAPVSVTPPDQAFAPIFNPPGGTYLVGQTVSISSLTPGAVIRYTLDGSSPTETHGTIYAGPVSIEQTATLKAVAAKAGLLISSVSTATYIIDNGPPNTKFALTGAAVTASSFTSTNYPANAIDGNLATSWASNGDGQWLQFDLGAPSRIGFLNIATSTSVSRSYVFDLLASNDGANWTAILTNGQTPFNAGLQKFDITDVQPVRYLRIVAHGSNYSATLNNFAEIEIWGGPATGGGGTPPATPTGLAAVGGDAAVTLNWSVATGANSYNVKRATSPGGPYATIAAGVVATQYVDTSVVNATTYYYVVTGVNLYGSSDDSLEVSATPRGLSPVPPASISATPGDGHVVVAWSAAPKAVSYNVKRATNLGGPYTLIATGTASTVFTDVGLTNGTTYSYVVSGVNVDGEGADSAEVSATPQAGYPGVWHILTPLTWGQAGGGFCPATYAFDEQPTWDDATQQPVGVSAVPHQSTLTSYANRYWYMDLGPDYATLRITQMWTRYRPNSAGTYEGFAGMWWDNDFDNINDGINAPGMNFSAGGVVPNVNPQLWVRDRDFTSAPITPQGRYLVVSTGPTVSSRPNEFAFVGYVDVAAPPAPPTGLTAAAVTTNGDARISLSWSAALGATSYNVKRAATSSGPFVTVASGVTGTTHVDGGLTDGATYHYVITSVNTRGESAASAVVSATADATPPALTLPAPLTVEATSAAGAVVSFEVSALDNRSGPVTATAVPVSGSVFPIGLTDVLVSATDEAGNTATASFTVTVRDTTAPVIEQLTASRTSLWPANHSLVAIALTATVTDSVDPAPRTKIISVTSNEPELGTIDDDVAPDWVITGDLTLKLRAERADVGNGRVYTITVESRDAADNASTRTIQVKVPKNQG